MLPAGTTPSYLEPDYKSSAELLEYPAVSGCADLAIDLARDFKTACQGLEKVATGHAGRDTKDTAQIMRDIACETLIAVKYGDYAKWKE